MVVDQIISDIIRREGDTYSDDPLDRGGPTKYGITLRTLSAYFRETKGREATALDVQQLTEQDAQIIYYQIYVREPGFAKIIDTKLLALIVDSGVNHGPETATKWVQAAVGVKVDGVLGPVTADAVNRILPRKVFVKVLASRFKYYAAIVKSDPSQLKWINGWTNRACEFLEDCV